MASAKKSVFLNIYLTVSQDSIVGMLQLFWDKTETSLKADATVTYPVYIVLLNVRVTFIMFSLLTITQCLAFYLSVLKLETLLTV